MAEDDKVKAARLRREAYNRTTSSDTLDVLREALSFIERHSEPWYFSGQELCGRMEAIIAQEELK
jgi:hypothetical protein